MARPMSVSDSIHVDVDPRTAYDAFSDVAQMGRWSPENRGADAAAGEALGVGDRFEGLNKRGRARWKTSCEVVVADAPHHFAFTVDTWGVRKPWLKATIATWDYRFEDLDGGTQVHQTWVDERTGWPDWAAKAFDKVATGTTFARYQRGNIERTLRAFKREMESAG